MHLSILLDKVQSGEKTERIHISQLYIYILYNQKTSFLKAKKLNSLIIKYTNGQ